MSHTFKTNVVVQGTIRGQNVAQNVISEALVATKQLTAQSEAWQRVTAAVTQNIVLPDATALLPGLTWIVQVKDVSVASVAVQSYDATTPVTLKTIEAGRAYSFTLVGAGTEAGEWFINYLEEADSLPTSRHVEGFVIADWTLVGGLYELDITGATHTRGVSPTCELYEGMGPYQETDCDVIVAANGDIKLKVNSVPDARFDGKLVAV